MTPRRRRVAWGAVTLISLAGVGVWWAGAERSTDFAAIAGHPRAAAEAPPTPAATPSARAEPAAPSPATVPSPTPAAPDPSKPTLDPVSLGERAANDYRRRARFPPYAHPLEADEPDPITRDREVTAIKARGQNGAEPTLYVFPAQSGFEAPDTVQLFAYLAVRDNPIPAQDIRGTVQTEDGQPLGEVAYHDDGVDGDPLAGDNIYSTTFTLPETPDPPLAASYLVRVRAVTMSNDERLAASSFLYSRPHARLTGRYRDSVVSGTLIIDAEVDVSAAGRFHIEGTLYDRTGTRGLLWAQNAVQLAPGVTWMTLPFYGLALREAGIDGPYVLRYVALSTTTQMPNAKNRLAEWVHVTKAYRATEFTDQPFQDPDLLDAAERLERDNLKGGLEAGGR